MKKNFIKIILSITLIFSVVFNLHAQKAHALTLSPDRAEISGAPGVTLYGTLILLNEGKEKVTYYSSTANFQAQGESGTPSFDLEGKKDLLASWIVAPASINLEPGESQSLPYSVVIPQDTLPGGYFAGLFWSTAPPDSKDDNIAITARLGSLILLSVTGDVKQGGGIVEYKINDEDYLKNHNDKPRKFFTALPIDFYYRFQNTGDDRIKPKGSIFIKNILGMKSAAIDANKGNGNILPRNSIRRFDVKWAKGEQKASTRDNIQGFWHKAVYEWNNFAFGPYKAVLDLTYGDKNIAAKQTVKFFVFPWHILIVIVLVLFIGFYLLRKLARSYNRYVIGQAEKMMMMAKELNDKENAKNDAPKTTVRRRV